MAVVTVKSTLITNLDSSPVVANTIGEFGPGFLRTIGSDNVLATSGDSANSIYRFVRLPTQAKIKRLFTTIVGNTGTVSVDIDVAFSDSLNDGTQPALAGGIVQTSGPADNKLFGAAVALTGTAAVVKTDRTLIGSFTPTHQNLPLWQVLVNLGATQFTSDPGGFFDIVYKVTTAAATANTNHTVEVDYVE